MIIFTKRAKILYYSMFYNKSSTFEQIFSSFSER